MGKWLRLLRSRKAALARNKGAVEKTVASPFTVLACVSSAHGFHVPVPVWGVVEDLTDIILAYSSFHT